MESESETQVGFHNARRIDVASIAGLLTVWAVTRSGSYPNDHHVADLSLAIGWYCGAGWPVLVAPLEIRGGGDNLPESEANRQLY